MPLKSFPIFPPFQIFFSLLSIFSLFFLSNMLQAQNCSPESNYGGRQKSSHYRSIIHTGEYNNLQLLDYTHRVSFVTITTYNCLHCNSCNVPKITKSSLKNSKVANCSKVTRSTGLWTLPPAWGSFARTANFQPRNSGGKSDCLHLFYRHFVFSDLDLIDWWRFVNLK